MVSNWRFALNVTQRAVAIQLGIVGLHKVGYRDNIIHYLILLCGISQSALRSTITTAHRGIRPQYRLYLRLWYWSPAWNRLGSVSTVVSLWRFAVIHIKPDPVTEPFIVDKDFILDAWELLNDWDKISHLKMLWVFELQNILHFRLGNIPIMIFVNLIDGSHHHIKRESWLALDDI